MPPNFSLIYENNTNMVTEPVIAIFVGLNWTVIVWLLLDGWFKIDRKMAKTRKLIFRPK